MWVIATIASLAAVIILVLCIPLNAVLRIDVHGRPKSQVKLVWFFGLVSKEITRGKKGTEEEKGVAKGKQKPGKRRIKARSIFQILRTRGLLKQLKRLLQDILKCLKIRDLKVNLRIGLDDPADTGLLLALIGPATFFLGSSRVHEIRVQPSFEDEAVFEGYLHGAVRLVPIQLAIPFLRFVFSLAAIRTAKTLVLAKWKRTK